jgi:hypothetical protein
MVILNSFAGSSLVKLTGEGRGRIMEDTATKFIMTYYLRYRIEDTETSSVL